LAFDNDDDDDKVGRSIIMSAQTTHGAAQGVNYQDPSAVIQEDKSDKSVRQDSQLDIESGEVEKTSKDLERAPSGTTTIHEGEAKFKQLGWVKLTVCLIVEAIALGSLSIPSVFATVGMVAGVLLVVGLGLISIYTSYLVGQVKLKYPHVTHYAEAVGLMFGRVGFEITSVMFVLVLVLLLGSHVLTGTIAWVNIVDNPTVCALVFSVVSAILIFVLALPPSFDEFAWLGYVDFVSILAAIGITIIATGVQASNRPGGLGAVEWSLYPPPGTTFYQAFESTTNVILAYSFAICQFSFMDEMAKPKDYIKSIWALGIIEIVIYTITGALIYAFVGPNVRSPALLSAGSTVSRIAFGVALPVIFISGSINGVVAGRYILRRAFPNGTIQYVNTVKGWLVWVPLVAIQVVIAWIIAEAIPFFNALLGLISSLLISGFSYYFPALFWFFLLKEGKWNKDWRNIGLSIFNLAIFMIGMAILGCGTYANVQDIVDQYAQHRVRGSFSCAQAAYN
jgi:hypothetical protein